ncbi:streptococcin A-M57 [Lactobacillus sp. LL6]|uniref:streptococcin A-M57 n=1 Tax=unclassified Lactobacillus TaxID=2620435 RepID=UPI0011850E48|nr:streptococcin A-M57 [Lactobacillus sp. LL6]TSO26678.1 streptococcin A-M57 [Lactobacillus sp. LL6]
MNKTKSQSIKIIKLLMVFTIILELFATLSSNVYASDSVQSQDVDTVATELQKMFAHGVSQENLNKYAKENFSKQELQAASRELDVNYLANTSSTTYSPFISMFSWNSMGKCMYNKIKDELFAMVNVGVIVKYAKKKAWKELAKVVIRVAKGAGVKTNAILVAGQLAVWAVACGMEWN